MVPMLMLVSTMTFQITSYRSVPEQTDSTPFYTSIGLHVRKGFCAVSRDVLGNQINYGDVLYVQVTEKPDLSRYCFVADTMNKRIRRGIDFWVASKTEERLINVRHGHVYKLIKTNTSIYKPITTTNSKRLLEPFNRLNNKLLESLKIALIRLFNR